MRPILMIAFIVVLTDATTLQTHAQNTERADAKSDPLTSEADDDKQLSNVLFDRYAAAYVEMDARTALYNAGRVTLAEVCAAITRYSTAGLELAKTPAGRVAVCEQAFKEAKKIEEAAEAKYKAEIEPVQQMMLATYTRCDMELKLHKAKKEKAVDKSGDESEVPRLIAPPHARPVTGT